MHGRRSQKSNEDPLAVAPRALPAAIRRRAAQLRVITRAREAKRGDAACVPPACIDAGHERRSSRSIDRGDRPSRRRLRKGSYIRYTLGKDFGASLRACCQVAYAVQNDYISMEDVEESCREHVQYLIDNLFHKEEDEE